MCIVNPIRKPSITPYQESENQDVKLGEKDLSHLIPSQPYKHQLSSDTLIKNVTVEQPLYKELEELIKNMFANFNEELKEFKPSIIEGLKILQSSDLPTKTTFYGMKITNLIKILAKKSSILKKILNINAKTPNDLLKEILKIEKTLDRDSPIMSILSKVKDIIYCQKILEYQKQILTESNCTFSIKIKIIENLFLIRNIDLRMQINCSLELQINNFNIHQILLIDKLNNYIKNYRAPSYDINISGLCHGLTCLYGYYEFLEEKDTFFHRIERCLNINMKSFSPNLSEKTYIELTEEERAIEDLCNEILYLQGKYEKGQQKTFPQTVKFVSDRREIKEVSSKFIYISLFEYDKDKKYYDTLYHTFMEMVNIDETPKFLSISTGSHAIGIFFRKGHCFLYDPNSASPSLPYNSTNEKEMIALTTKLASLLRSQTNPIALSIDIVSNEPLKNIDKLHNDLYPKINPGTNILSYNNSTPLHIACYDGYADVAELLLEHNANINQPDNNGFFPLHTACYKGHADIAKLLLEHNANIDQPDNDGFLPLQVARYKGHADVAELLLKRQDKN